MKVYSINSQFIHQLPQQNLSVIHNKKSATENTSKSSVPIESLRANFLCSFSGSNNSIKEMDNIKKCSKQFEQMFFPEIKYAYFANRVLLFSDLNTFLNDLEQLLDEHNIDKPAQIVQVLKTVFSFSDNKIQEYAKDNFDAVYSFQAYAKMLVQKEFVQVLVDVIKKLPQNTSITKGQLQELLTKTASQVDALHSQEIQNNEVRKILKYQNTEDNLYDEEDKIKLTESEISLIRECSNFYEVVPLRVLLDKFLNDYVECSSALRDLVTPRIQLATLQTCERYNVANDEQDKTVFEKHPLTRWLGIYPWNKFDGILDKIKVGNIYSYNNMQSCSKNTKYAEEGTDYRDDCIDMNMKFVIHPKKDLTKAYDIGMRKYGDREVIYPAGTEFIVLDKKMIKATSINGSSYRWVIHMQEK